MKAKLLTVALAIAVATTAAVGGVTAATSASDAAVQPDEGTTVDGYEFDVTDHDDWLADRDADAETVAERLLTDDEVGAELRALFDTDAALALDVYGSLQNDDDSAHVIVTPAPGIDDSSAAEQEPRLEATVDLGDDTVEFVGASTRTDGDAVQRNVSEVDATLSVSAENTTGDTFAVRTFDGDVLSTDGHDVVDVLVSVSSFAVEIVDPEEANDE